MASTARIEKRESSETPSPPAKTPPRTRPPQALPPSKNLPSSSSPSALEDRTAVLEKELARARKRADARGKEADSLRRRVQELEPEVRKLAKELEKRREESRSRSPVRSRKQVPPTSTALRENDVALRGRLAAADNRAKILQLRCDQLEHERSFGATDTRSPGDDDEQGAKAKHDDGDSSATTYKTNCAEEVRDHGLENDNETKRIKRQLEVAERRVKNSLYINEAHESLAAKATEKEMEASARATELARRLDRALEKLESIERKDMILNLEASCTRDEESIHLTERELRAHQMDPELYLPINTAKRRQLARSEQRLHRLRLRHQSQAAALCQAHATERLHANLRSAAGLGDVSETLKCLDSGISVNVPDQSGLSAFLYACGQGNAELIRVLLEYGGDVFDGNGVITGLIIAARKGTVEVVQTLLDAGADVSARDSAGGIALHAATLRRHVDAARVLLEAGSDCNAIDQGNNTPLHMLASAPSGEGGACVVQGGADAQLVALLLEWGASAVIKNSKGFTPMSAALDTRNRATVLAYREFFGEDSSLTCDVGWDAESSCGEFIPDAVCESTPSEEAGKSSKKAPASNAPAALTCERQTATA